MMTIGIDVTTLNLFSAIASTKEKISRYNVIFFFFGCGLSRFL